MNLLLVLYALNLSDIFKVSHSTLKMIFKIHYLGMFMICLQYKFCLAPLVTTIKSKSKENHCAGLLVIYDIAV